ncbi:LuxR C-terminal-related transcriptional regulator [Streptomyces griseus]|uniref:LuxR C-terminal-related transcriptional regulator n=1 Tax=Streptomyces griseus TaxID=1911 RepID=UPI0033B58CBD
MTDPMPEHDEVFAVAAGAAAAVRSGHARWLTLRAMPGMGRTTLLEETVRRETADGAMAARVVHCTSAESTYPFSLVRRLLPDAGQDVPFTEQPPADEQHTFHRLGARLERIARRQPLLLAVDDLHDADEVSRRWLGYLARRPAGLPVLLLSTECLTRPALALPEAHGTSVLLRPLSDSAVARLARRAGYEAGCGAGDAATALCVRAGAGNPTLVRALLADFADLAKLSDPSTLCGGTEPAGLREHPTGPIRPPRPIPSVVHLHRYRETIARWVTERMDLVARRLCLTLAVGAVGAVGGAGFVGVRDTAHITGPAGADDGSASPGTVRPTSYTAPSGPGLLSQVAAIYPGVRVPAPGSAYLAGLARLFADPLTGEAVLAASDPADLADLHLRFARLLHEQGAPATAVAAHLLHLDRPAEVWMSQCLEDAADALRDAGRPRPAAHLLRRALHGPLTPAHRATLSLRLGALELLHCSDSGVRQLRAALELHTDAAARAAVAPALGQALAAQGRTGLAVQVLHRESMDVDSTELARVLQSVSALIAAHDAVAWRDAVARMRELVSCVPTAIEPLVRALVMEYDAGAGRLSSAEAVRYILPRLSAQVHPQIRTGWLGSAATLLQWADRTQDALALADAWLPPPPAFPDLSDAGLQCLVSVRAEAALMTGDFRRVLAENDPLLKARTAQGLPMPHIVSMVALARFELGWHSAAWRLLAVPRAEHTDSSWEWNELRYARGLLHLDEGDWQAALDAFLACGTGQRARDFVSPVATPWRSGAAHALVGLGRPAQARELAEEDLGHARAWGTPRTVGRALRAHAAALGGRRGLEALSESVALLRTAPAPVELIESLTDLGRARIDAGNGRKGRADLREAHALAVRLLVPGGRREGHARQVHGAGAQHRQASADQGGGGHESRAGAGRLVRLTEKALRAGAARVTRPAASAGEALSPAERRIVRLAAQGQTNAQIGDALHLARRTVETHLTHAYRKLGVSRRTQLVGRLKGTTGLLDTDSHHG